MNFQRTLYMSLMLMTTRRTTIYVAMAAILIDVVTTAPLLHMLVMIILIDVVTPAPL